MSQQKLSAEQQKYEEFFKMLDKSGDGVLTIQELKRGLKEMGKDVNDAECVEMFQGVDEDGDGRITLREFVMQLTKPCRRQALTELFQKTDKDGNGILSRDEVTNLCKSVGSYTDDEVVQMIQQVDKNGDGKIDLKEFLDALL